MAGERGGHGPECLVSGLVPVGVVVVLEVVDVAQRQAVAAAVALTGDVQPLELVSKAMAVTQLGQRVGVGEIGQLHAGLGQLVVQVGHPARGKQPGLQVERVQGFAEVVIRARFHPGEHVGTISRGGQQDEIGVVVLLACANRAAQRHPVQAGHVPVGHQDVGPELLDVLPGRVTIGDGDALVSEGLDRRLGHQSGAQVVVGDEDSHAVTARALARQRLARSSSVSSWSSWSSCPEAGVSPARAAVSSCSHSAATVVAPMLAAEPLSWWAASASGRPPPALTALRNDAR